MTTIRVEILVIRTTADGSTAKASATVEGSGTTSRLGEVWMADKLASKTLRILDGMYWNLTKTLHLEE